MDNKDLTLLEFPRIRAMLADLCAFSLSREAALELLPSRDFIWIRARLEESREARRLLEAEPAVSVYGLEDIGPWAEAAVRGKTLDPAALGAVRQSLSVMRQLRQAVTRHRESIPRLAEMAAPITDFSPLEKSISSAISPEGELLPNASEKLSNIRSNQRSRRSELTDKLQSIIASDSQRRFIQEPIVTEREGRFVLAVKSESRGLQLQRPPGDFDTRRAYGNTQQGDRPARAKPRWLLSWPRPASPISARFPPSALAWRI